MSDRESLRAAGVLAEQISRKILLMVGDLHGLGHESLYLDARMSPSGTHWRYEIGAMDEGRWPSRSVEPVRGSIGGGFDQSLEWCEAADDLAAYVAGFRSRYSELLLSASQPNARYAEWYRRMLRETAPEGVLIFSADYGPHYEHAYTWGQPRSFRMALPPGCRHGGTA